MKSSVTWQDGMAFSAELDGFELKIDADEQFGGRGLGPKPKGLLLTSLVGCTAMDVVAILGKMHVEIDGLSVEADGELVSEHPKRFDRIVVRYRFQGKELPIKKLQRAVRLSEESFCGVRASLHPDIAQSTEIFINGELVADQ